jgi:hypothetical protein
MDINYTIDEKSPALGQPKKMTIPLTKYQKMMLYKAIEIENDFNDFGVFADSPGTGKTAVVLALILTGQLLNQGEQTLIIVPQNLLKQWENEINKFCGDTQYIVLDNYYKIVDMYSQDWKEYIKSFPILLAPSSFLSIINNTFEQTNYSIKRIVYDEIDTLEVVFDSMVIKEKIEASNTKSIYKKSTPIEGYQMTEISWFISASIINLVDDETELFKIGKIELSKENFYKRLVKCKDSVIQKYSLLNNTSVDIEKIKCSTVLDQFCELLSIEQLDFINSLSFTSIHGEYTRITAKKDEDIIPILINDYIEHCNYKKETLKSLNKRTFEWNETANIQDKEAKTKLSSEISFYENIIQAFYSVFKVSNTEDFNKKYKEAVSNHNENEKKQSKLKEFFKQVKCNNHYKVLLFSDYTNGFNTIIEILNELELKHTDLGKGNVNDINKAIEDFKEKDTQVLMIDSSSQGCGMNLENATHVVFLHKTLDTLYNQIVGRALRPGRTSGLTVKIYLNKNEIV